MHQFFKQHVHLVHLLMHLFLWNVKNNIFERESLCPRSWNFYDFVTKALVLFDDPRIIRRNHCAIHSTQRQTNDLWRIYEQCYKEPFSRIVKVKSPRVWDVICSTLVLYRSTTGLDRGVGVFKGDYTQRQGWLYWRMSPAVLTYIKGFPNAQE